MGFSTNSLFLYIIAIGVIFFVLAQSIFFLGRAYRRGRELGIDRSKLRKTIASTAVFTLAPAVSILIGIVTLSKFLGIPLPWIRMSVIGALTYELPAATSGHISIRNYNRSEGILSYCLGNDTWYITKHNFTSNPDEEDSGGNG